MKDKKSRTQRAYLLRCWREGGDTPGAAPRWRFSVEEVLSQQARRGFDDMEAALGFLRAEMAEDQERADHPASQLGRVRTDR